MVEINTAIIETIRKFLDKLAMSGIRIESAYLYGSYAKGVANEWSDIDIAVISSEFTGDRFEEGFRLMKLSCDIDSRIEPVTFRPEDFVDEDPLVWEIKKEGMLIEV